MSKSLDLKKRVEWSKEIQERKVNRVKKVIIETVNSPAFQLTALNHFGKNGVTPKELEEFANTIAEEVAKVATDPVVEFTDACKARGLKDNNIKNAVELINEVFGICKESNDYQMKLKAVAVYIHDKPNLYEDIVLLS